MLHSTNYIKLIARDSRAVGLTVRVPRRACLPTIVELFPFRLHDHERALYSAYRLQSKLAGRYTVTLSVLRAVPRLELPSICPVEAQAMEVGPMARRHRSTAGMSNPSGHIATVSTIQQRAIVSTCAVRARACREEG